MATSAEQLILRGLHIMMRVTFTPSDPAAQAKHFVSLQQDIGPWLSDYAEEIEKPAVDWNVDFVKLGGDLGGEGGGGLQS